MRSVILCVVLIIPVGCVQLTEEQRNQISTANAAIVAIEARIGRLLPVANDLYKKIKDVVEKMAKGEMPKEQGEGLIKLYKSKRDAVQEEIRAGVDEVKTIKGVVVAINDAGVPWYQQLWLLLPGLLAGGAAALNRHGKFRGASEALATSGRVLGVLARAGNNAPGFGAAVHSEAKSSGVSVSETDAAWNRAHRRHLDI